MINRTNKTPVAEHIHAAQYLRMSTEHQEYSPQNQADAIQQYAAVHQMTIVRTYADHGRSGLKVAGRAGLRTLLDDVASRRHDFTALLVYDISRWGVSRIRMKVPIASLCSRNPVFVSTTVPSSC
jgi:DNA invertase Pin-like site-specific DNA recombinase